MTDLNFPFSSGVLMFRRSRWFSGVFLAGIFIQIGSPGSALATEGITIRARSVQQVGEVAPGVWLLPNGRHITPAGDLVEVDDLPLAVEISRDGRYAVTSSTGGGDHRLLVVDLETQAVVDEESQGSLFVGLRFDEAGSTLYASGGGNGILVYDFADGQLTLRETWGVFGHVNGLDLGRNEKILYAVTQIPSALISKDVETGEMLDRIRSAGDPYTVVVNPRFKQVYVSSMRENTVDFYNVELARTIRHAGSVPVQKGPQDMIVSDDGHWLYVVNSDEDSFTIVDLRARTVRSHVDLRPFGDFSEYGSAPNALAIHPTGDRLYIAQGSENAVAVVGLPHGELLGRIPTAWYPTGVAISPDGLHLVIVNGKGTGTRPNGRLSNTCVLQILPVPDSARLEKMSAKVNRNMLLPQKLFKVDEDRFDGPVPLHRGEETPIKHVFFVVRENKTYDAILGAWEGGRGEPENCLFCGDPTVNLYSLVNTFASGDNYYSNAEESLQGHELVTAAITNSFVEKQRLLSGRGFPFYVDGFLNPAAFPKKDFIFQNCLRNDVSFRDYGEALGVGPDLLIFNPKYVHWGPFDPPVFWLQSRDVDKMRERISEWERDGIPQLVFMLLPNDHHSGCQWPYPSPESMVADNDEATGRFIDWLSHSEYWDSSVVFVVEDDPQQGTDHVDPHRSLLLVASPWVTRGYVSPVIYCEANIHATIERILNLPPMTQYDEVAQPMWDLFTNEPDFSPWEFIPRVVPPGPCPMGTELARRSEGLNWTVPDQAEGLDDLSRDFSREKKGAMELSEGEANWARAWRAIGEKLIEIGPDETLEPETASPERE